MRLLFIKLKHIGDALIMTPMLTAVRARHPEAEIHVVVRHGTEGILAGCPAIDQLHTPPLPPASASVARSGMTFNYYAAFERWGLTLLSN